MHCIINDITQFININNAFDWAILNVFNYVYKYIYYNSKLTYFYFSAIISMSFHLFVYELNSLSM